MWQKIGSKVNQSLFLKQKPFKCDICDEKFYPKGHKLLLW